MIRLRRPFYNRPTIRVARELLGKYVFRASHGRKIIGLISETEAYRGPKDEAAHTFGGRRTKRTEAMFWDGGTAYVYFTYGIHWLLNVVTAGAGKPEAVLIRGVIPCDQNSNPIWDRRKEADGPAKVCRYLRIDRSFYGEDMVPSKRLWIEDRGMKISRKDIKKGPRIGIDYADLKWRKKPWRFWIN
jgi:DNA-3-methyladenine glycosylase